MSKEEKKTNTKQKTNNKNKPKATKKTDNKPEIKKEKTVKVVEKIEEKKNTTEKIKKIEEKAKKENKMPKTKKSKKESFTKVITKVDEKRKIIYGFIGGLLLGLLIMVIFMPDRIATLKDGTQPLVTVDGENITADELYTDMKNQYPITMLLDKIDRNILNELYEEDEEMTDTVNSNAENTLSQYSQYYGTESEAETLEIMGFSSYDQLIDYFKLSYLKEKYLDDYVEENLTDKEIEKYYDKNVFGDINCEHVLVSVSDDGLSESDAKDLAEEIIKKINDGTSWEDIKTEYKDQVTYENLGYQSWDASLETTFMDAIKEMKEDSYSKEPVKTSYGYHVIHKLDQKDAPKLKDAKETIIEKLVDEKKEEDENLLYKALISLRKEHKLEFKDTEMKEKYEDYSDEYK